MTDHKFYSDNKNHVNVIVDHKDNGVTIFKLVTPSGAITKLTYVPDAAAGNLNPPNIGMVEVDVVGGPGCMADHGHKELELDKVADLKKKIEDAYQGFKNHPSLTQEDAELVNQIVMGAAKKCGLAK